MKGTVDLQRGHSPQVENHWHMHRGSLYISVQPNSVLNIGFLQPTLSTTWELLVSLCISRRLPGHYRPGIELRLPGLVWLAGIMELVLTRTVSRMTGVLSGTFHHSG